MSNDLPVCPLCAGTAVNVLDKVKASDLDALYRRATDYSIASMFKEVETLSLCCCEKCDLRYFFPVVGGTEAFYENLQKFDWYYFDDKPEFDFALQYMKSGDSVLEIGAGKGAFGKKTGATSYTGLEFSQQAIKFAEANGICLLAQSIQEYSKKNQNKHDFVCNFQVLEHVSEVHAFLESSVTCLKPGGTMVISVPAAESFSRYVRNFWSDMPPHHLTRWTDLCLANVAKRYGLELVTIHHESLQEAHKIFYASTVFSNAFFRLLGRPFHSIDLSLFSRLIDRVSAVAAKIFCKGLSDQEFLPRGLSVVAVYRKPHQE